LIGAFLKGMHILMIFFLKLEDFLKNFNHTHPNLEDEKWRNNIASRFKIPLKRELYVKVPLRWETNIHKVTSHLSF
jgi:hypothetical protein